MPKNNIEDYWLPLLASDPYFWQFPRKNRRWSIWPIFSSYLLFVVAWFLIYADQIFDRNCFWLIKFNTFLFNRPFYHQRYFTSMLGVTLNLRFCFWTKRRSARFFFFSFWKNESNNTYILHVLPNVSVGFFGKKE